MTTDLKNRVMRRVYMVSYLRRALSPAALKLYAAIFLLWGIGREVWVDRVFENSPGLASPINTLNFFANAFTGAEVLVQVFVVGFTLASLWFAADLIFRRSQAFSTAF